MDALRMSDQRLQVLPPLGYPDFLRLIAEAPAGAYRFRRYSGRDHHSRCAMPDATGKHGASCHDRDRHQPAGRNGPRPRVGTGAESSRCTHYPGSCTRTVGREGGEPHFRRFGPCLRVPEIRMRAAHAAKLVPSVRDRSSRSRMNFTRIEVLACSREKFRKGIAEGDGDDLFGGGQSRANGTVRIQEPKDRQTSLVCVAERI